MSITVEELAQAFLADDANLAEHRSLTRQRETTLPRLQAIMQDFVNGNTSLQKFRDEFSKIVNPSFDPWFAQGRFRMELNKLIKNHNTPGAATEASLRGILSGLTQANMGQRIEQFYQFTLKERERLRNQGVSGNSIVAPGNSALIISLFAAWLDPRDDGTLLYNRDMREGLYRLYKENLLSPPPSPLKFNVSNDVIEINTNADHEAFISAIHELLRQAPQLKIDAYWADSFLFWARDYFQSLTKIIIDPTGNNGPLSPTPTQGSTIKDGPGSYTVSVNQELFLKNEQLQPTPEPLLTRLIREVQRHILVEESVIRRIYHALLAGHVILSGPPGTGKTELARLIPEILWQRPENEGDNDYDPTEITFTKTTAYTTSLVTATDEWSVRTLISGIAPVSNKGYISYKVQYGHLTSAILKNWTSQSDNPDEWGSLTLRRSLVTSSSGVERGTPLTFRGQWLVIDEFNRAPIDLALGDALTALGGNDVLRVAIEGGSAELPIPKDFRLIGTLNSFDRNYLNQISEALKRRFSFVEILPPGRSLREAEQAIVLYKALERVSHLSKEIGPINEVTDWEEAVYGWSNVIINKATLWKDILVGADPEGRYKIIWSGILPDKEPPFQLAFEAAWRLFEVIRIYRQLGTAQAISLVRHMLIAGILQGYTTREQWIGQALDAALCDTIADQLQVLLPDEIDALLLALTSERPAFSAAYNRLLARLADRQQRLYGQLLSLSSVSDEHGQAYLSDEEVEAIAQSNAPEVAPEKLAGLFHLNAPMYRLPQFTRRLRAFKAERGL